MKLHADAFSAPQRRRYRRHSDRWGISPAQLKAWRLAVGWTQQKLADRARIHVQSVKHWENSHDAVVSGFAVGTITSLLKRTRVPCPELEEARAMVMSCPCRAKTRAGTPCRLLSVPGRTRCKWHGGCSTGPKTAEDRERIRQGQHRRWTRRFLASVGVTAARQTDSSG